MKKIVLGLLFISGSAWGAYFPPVMVPTGVTASTVAVVNGATPFQIANSTTAVNVLGTVPVSISGSTIAVRQDGSIWTIANSTIGVVMVTPHTVVQSTSGVNGSTIAVVNAVGTNLNVVFPSAQATTVANSTIAVVGLGYFNVGNSTLAVVNAGNFAIANSTIAVNVLGTPNAYVTNVTTSPAMVKVSSNTALPTAAADATQVQMMGDGSGRVVIIAGVPTAIQQSTAPAAITGVTSVVLVSSPSATTFTHMCGCVVGNTSATNTYVTFFLRGDLTSAGSKRMMAPANNIPTGYPLDCSRPFLDTRGGEQVAVQAAASVSSIYIDCKYYQSTVP